MIKVRHEITIHEPIDEVFEFIANSANHPKWNSDYVVTTVTSEEPISVGTVGKSIGLFLGKTYESTIECAEFSPPYNVAHHASIGPAEVETRNGLRRDGNVTRIMHDRRIRLRGLKRLYEPFIGKKIRKKVIADLEKLQLYFRLKSSAGF
jgi:uncharacterized membrane protein